MLLAGGVTFLRISLNLFREAAMLDSSSEIIVPVCPNVLAVIELRIVTSRVTGIIIKLA